jgi:hypothetical protein
MVRKTTEQIIAELEALGSPPEEKPPQTEEERAEAVRVRREERLAVQRANPKIRLSPRIEDRE